MKDLLEYIGSLDEYKKILNLDSAFILNGAAGALSPIMLNMLSLHTGKQIVFIAQNDYNALEMQINTEKSVFFPMRETLLRPAAVGRENTLKRVNVLNNIAQADVICVSINALRQRLCPKSIYFNSFLKLTQGMDIAPNTIVEHVINLGYTRVQNVSDIGEIALRGDILDICIDDNNSCRIEFFGDNIEKISGLDIQTQRTQKTVYNNIMITPVCEFVLDKFLQKRVQQQSLTLKDNLHLSDSLRNIVHLIYDEACLFDYLKDYICVFDGTAQVTSCAKIFDEEFSENIKTALYSDYYIEGMEKLIISFEKIMGIAVKNRKVIDICGLQKSVFKNGINLDFGSKNLLHTYSSKIFELASDIKKRLNKDYRIFLFCGSVSRKETLINSLLNEDVFELKDMLSISSDNLKKGFEIQKLKLLVLGENDIYGEGRGKHKSAGKKQTSLLFDDLKTGDIIVHDLHGRGKYMGLKTEKVAGIVRDYIVLEYLNSDRLYLPVDQIGRIQKYLSGSDTAPKLNKLGGQEWENTKTKARASLKDLAEQLFKLYSKRANAKGYMFSADTIWQSEFENAFEYEETSGQLQVINEIKADMEHGKAMDRLLLGDVGYGKTEVAMRACFKSVMDQKQCAVLSPTTLLCAQHFETFKKRFADFPVNITMLSRFVSASEQKKAVAGLAQGSIDIVVGTHRLLSKDIAFNDLGLLIVDEEHRFGVAHKEKIKEIKENVDVLSLSATPIPRTLEMSLIGIRNLSTIDTPIEERIPISTYVLEYSIELVHEAVMREKARNGQVFFVCRKIATLGYIASQIEEHIPEADFRIAHGQMDKERLENTMKDFIDNKFDILLSTTIVESGLDIKNANTIIIYEADKFGLSELYQLKGRVGRSTEVAYAYLTFMSEASLTPDAVKRLNTLKDFTEFGSGMKIAMRDLEIRGAGNMLGSEQSGHMANIGYEMYLRMMKEAVSELKGEETKPEFDTAVELAINAHVDREYIEDNDLRLEVYKKIVAIDSKASAKNVEEELTERFGKPPVETKNLITVSLLRSYAKKRQIASIIRKPNSIEMKFIPNAQINVNKLVKCLEKYTQAKIKPAEPISIIIRNKLNILELFSVVGEIDCI